MIDYWKLGIAGALLIAAFSTGWYVRNLDYQAFKLEVLNTAKAQEAHVASITKQQALVTKGIENEYEAKLAAVRNYYKSTSVWNNPSSGKVSGISAAPSTANVIAAYNEIAGLCAETTVQTIALQDWIRQQTGIK
jgi:hypothetical protein